MRKEQSCSDPSCFICLMEEPDSSIRRARIANYFKQMPLIDDEEHVLVLSELWNIAMTRPDDPHFPSLGIFECMANLIQRGLTNKDWLLRDRNVYIPYYAAHIIGSYTMNKAEFAAKAVDSGVIPPLMELLRGRMSWVEQRVAVRALGHLASYESTFEAVAEFEEEVVNLGMDLASTCLQMVYSEFVGVENKHKRLRYHQDLLTRGVGGSEMESRKAEEWASQLQCWSLNLLNCFAIIGKSIAVVCDHDFLKDLCQMWGGLVNNNSSPAGVGLIRILCYSQIGRKRIAESPEVIEKLCNLSRSSDDWQYMGIDCLLLLLNDPSTRYKVIEIATLCLIDLIQLRTLGPRSNVGEAIARTLLMDFRRTKSKMGNHRAERALEEIWDLKMERRKREEMLPEEKVIERRVWLSLLKQEGNRRFRLGEIGEALLKYTEALGLCPLRLRKERIVLYSNRAQCYLLLNDPDSAISDTTRALCLSSPVNSHGKSLWRRSQAYDMKGLAKESLFDCTMFVNCCADQSTKHVRIPYYVAGMISKQMNATWVFATALSKEENYREHKSCKSEGYDDDDDDDNRIEHPNDEIVRTIREKKSFTSGLSTIIEEPLIKKRGGSRIKLERGRGRKINA